MSSTFPLTIDSFFNPTSGTLLNATVPLKHSTQHTNINDAVFAVQTRIGVTSSSVPTTIDFELHDVSSGHNHDGVNSRNIANLPFAAILADCWGPFEGYATGSLTGSYEEMVYTNKIFLASKTWYTDQSKSKKIIEKLVTRNSNKMTNKIIWNVFEKDGFSIRTVVTDTLSYASGGIVATSVLRNVSSSVKYI